MSLQLNYFVVTTADEQRWQIYQALLMLTNLIASNGVAAPSSPTDFSTLPGGVIPTGNQVYFANRDENTLWTISASDTEWKVIDKSAI